MLVAILSLAGVSTAQEAAPPADVPVLLDFGNAVAPPAQNPATESVPPPESQPVVPSQTEPVQVPQAPPPTTQAPPPHSAPVAVPPDARYGDSNSESFARLSVYFELLGLGLLYSLNVDLVLGDDIALRAGYSSFEFFGSVTLIPVTVSYLGYGSADHRYEVGAGMILTQDGFDDQFAGTVVIGYRYQPVTGGLNFRTGLAGIWIPETGFPIPWPYLSLGAGF